MAVTFRRSLTRHSVPNRYGPAGPALFGVPFAGPYARLGLLQVFGIVGAFLVALPASGLLLPESCGEEVRLGVAILGASFISFVCLHPALAAASFGGALKELYEQSPSARVRVYPGPFGASLDVAGLRRATEWGVVSLRFRGRWALPWRRHSVELGIRMPVPLQLYANTRGTWQADEQTQPLRGEILACLAAFASSRRASVHLSVYDGEIRLGVHGCSTNRKGWAKIDRTFAAVMNIVQRGGARATGYRDQAPASARLEALRAMTERTRSLEIAGPVHAWWLAVGRERRWRREDLQEPASPSSIPEEPEQVRWP